MGISAEGLGRDHWNEMLAYPRKPIAHWHSLVEVKKSFKEVGEVAWPLACLLHGGVGWRMAVGGCETLGLQWGGGVGGYVGPTCFSPAASQAQRKEGRRGKAKAADRKQSGQAILNSHWKTRACREPVPWAPKSFHKALGPRP